MEVPRLRLLMQGLHSIESGELSPERVNKVGWAHAISEARSKRIGRTATEAAEEFRKYAETRDQEREGILVIGLVTSVEMSE